LQKKLILISLINDDTIAAIATPPGKSAIGIVRLSGKDAFSIAGKVFSGKNPCKCKSHTIHLGKIVNSKKEEIDEVLMSVFKAPKSYTSEDIIEFGCHGSPYVLSEILNVLIENGARLAQAGEFTLRAFINGKIDLAQAEAVADIIDSESATSHRIAIQYMRGGFSDKIKLLRQELLDIFSLFELELDFAEEDVEFASNNQLLSTLDKISYEINTLSKSFYLGNALKKGVSVVIGGRPNAGKSTLLNALLNEERAIISEIPGTTRDFIEDFINIDGIEYRFIDTAGITKTIDIIEQKGIEKTIEKINSADIVIYLFDVNSITKEDLKHDLSLLKHIQKLIVAGNKIDKCETKIVNDFKLELKSSLYPYVFLSSKFYQHIDDLKEALHSVLNINQYSGESTIISNFRHFSILQKIGEEILDSQILINQGVSKELIAINLRNITNLMGQITGEITNDEILGNIFSRFCIGK